MNKLHKVFILSFADINLDCYISESTATADALWLSRETIGKLLGFQQPSKAVKDIHSAHKALLDDLSVNQNGTVYYDFRALIDICYASDAQNKDDIAKVLWGIVDGILGIRRVLDTLDENEAKDFIESIPDEMKIQEFLLLCMSLSSMLEGDDVHAE